MSEEAPAPAPPWAQWIAALDDLESCARALLAALCTEVDRPRAPKRLPLERVQGLFAATVPDAAHTPQRARRLAGILDALHAAQAVNLPKSKRLWSQRTDPPLPDWVEVRWAGQAASSPGDGVVWSPMLAFASSERNPARLQTLVQINRYYSANPPARLAPVPLKERSLMIFGDEKRLDALRDADGADTLFDGRLRLDQLRCYRVPMPLATVGLPDPPSGLALIVIENKDTFDSIARWNRVARHFSVVVFGGGNAFEAGHETLDAEHERSHGGDLLYFGDIDASGVVLPLRVNRLRARAGLPPLRPAIGAYRWLLHAGEPRPSKETRNLAPAMRAALHDWLGGALADAVLELIAAGTRIPQETLSLDVLNSQDNPFAASPRADPT